MKSIFLFLIFVIFLWPRQAAAPGNPDPGFLSLLTRIRTLEIEAVYTVESIKVKLEHIYESRNLYHSFPCRVRPRDK